VKVTDAGSGRWLRDSQRAPEALARDGEADRGPGISAVVQPLKAGNAPSLGHPCRGPIRYRRVGSERCLDRCVIKAMFRFS
jgi:hypothetical protein